MDPDQLDPANEDAPPTSGEARFDALLDERFSAEGKERFAREITAHDANRAVGGYDPALARRRIRFRGEVPEKITRLLTGWIPELIEFAIGQGLTLRDPYLDLEVFSRAAFEADQGGLPAGLKLPASSYHFDPLPHRYSVRVVLPESLDSTEAMLTVLRSVLARIYGDVFLREEIYTLAAYREDVESGAEDASAGLAEQLTLLAELPVAHPPLEAALAAYARNVGINHKKHPEQARKSFFKESSADFERQRLAPERQTLIEDAFAAYRAALVDDPGPEVERLLEAVEALNRQLTFLPPAEEPGYRRLRSNNPLHFLRSVKLRLEFLLEALSGAVEDFDALDAPGAVLSPLAEERVGGNLSHLEREGLARPYLVPGATLSDDLERKRLAFPLEVQGMLARFPRTDHPERLFNSLRKKLESNLHQRLYHALVLLRQWIRRHESGQGEAFAQSDGRDRLKGMVANFRFRKPLVESLFIRIGVVLEVAERQADALGGGVAKARFPAEAFARAWGQFAAHALLAGYVGARGALKGFDPGRYRGQVVERLKREIEAGGAAGHPPSQLGAVLWRLHGGDGQEGLPVCVEVLRAAAPSFRYAVGQSLKARPEGKTSAEWIARLEASAAAVLAARESSLKYAIVVGEDAGAS